MQGGEKTTVYMAGKYSNVAGDLMRTTGIAVAACTPLRHRRPATQQPPWLRVELLRRLRRAATGLGPPRINFIEASSIRL